MTDDLIHNAIAEIKRDMLATVAMIQQGIDTGIEWIKSEAMKIVVLATQTNFGTKVLNLVQLFETKPLSGAEKMKGIIKALYDIGSSLLTAGGWTGIFASVTHFLQGVVQLVFNDFAADMAKLKHA